MLSKKPSLRLLLAGWLLVVGWLAALPGVLPLAFAAVAWIDGEHGVEMRGAGDDVSVVLTHGAQNAGKAHEQIHHHGVLGRALTCSAQSPRGGVDHVMKFAASSTPATERKATVRTGGSEVSVTVPAAPMDFVAIEFPAPTVVAKVCPTARLRGCFPAVPAQQHALLI